jgi:RNA 2',3'-cyclic 3'-phosphodiesterase
MKKIRTFIAIEVPEEIKAYLSDMCRDLAADIPAAAVRWVRPEAMHLTLRFLGDTAVEQLPQIGDALDVTTTGRRAFPLALDKLGCFPNPKRPRVIWAGITGALGQLEAVRNALDRALEVSGWPAETQAFQPHLTLGRVKDRQARISLPWGRPLEELLFDVTAVHLIESQLRPAGSIYTIRHSSVLDG